MTGTARISSEQYADCQGRTTPDPLGLWLCLPLSHHFFLNGGFFLYHTHGNTFGSLIGHWYVPKIDAFQLPWLCPLAVRLYMESTWTSISQILQKSRAARRSLSERPSDVTKFIERLGKTWSVFDFGLLGKSCGSQGMQVFSWMRVKVLRMLASLAAMTTTAQNK